MIEKLKAMEAAATPRPWHGVNYINGVYTSTMFLNLEDTRLAEALRNLAPELIALWEVVPRVLGDHVDCPDCSRSFIPEDPAHLELFNAYKALNAKAAEVLK